MPAFLIRFRWALSWALLILVLCLMPGAALPAWHWADLFSLDKLVHAALFAVLALLTLKAMHPGPTPRQARVALALLLAYGGSLEAMQMLTALGRRGDWNDVAANALGALCGWAWLRYRATRQRNATEAMDA